MWWRSRLRDSELDEEILAHLAIEVKNRIEAGESRENAERAARRQFGNVALFREETRSVWVAGWREALSQDLRFAIRGMRKAPGFAALAILTIGLGVGATTAVFGVVDGILLKPLPYPEPDRIAMLWRLAPVATSFGGEDFPWGKLDFSAFRDQSLRAGNGVFESLGAFQPDSFNLTGAGDPVFLEGSRASTGFFPAIGVKPAIGRFYGAEEDRPGQERVVVLSDRLWRDRFAADQRVIGRAIALNGFSYTVIGVMPPGFSFPHAEEMPASLEFPREAQLWVPLAIAPGERGASEMAVVGRMRQGVTLRQVQAELDVFAQTFERLFPASKEWSKSRAVSLEKQIVGDTRRPLLLLLAAVGLVLLIACSNVAGLVLTRSLGRRQEFGLRAALGAGHGRLVRQLLTENLLVALGGGLLGIAFAEGAIQFVRRFGPENLPRLREIALDPAALMFCLGVTLATGLLFGLAPGFGVLRDSLARSFRSGTRIAGGRISPRLRNGLLTGQIALALMLAVAAGLLVRTFQGLLNIDGGFRTDHVLTFELSLPPAKYADPAAMARLYSRALQTLRSLPGIESAGMVHAVPMGGAPDATVIRVPGRTERPNETPYANYMFTSPGYFATVQTPLLQGRDFSDGDTLEAEHVTIVNRAMADALWPNGDAVGQFVGVKTARYPVRRVVGVVANVKQSSMREETAPQMYVPYSQNEIGTWPNMRTMQVALRTASDPAAMTAGITRAMRSVDPDLPLAKVSTLTTLVGQSLMQPRFAMLLLVGFGVLALLLASIGMYGVISYSVSQRTQEIGVRMALGAKRGAVFGMVLAQGARLAVAGIAIGLAGAFAGMRALTGLLYGVKPADPATFAAVSALLMLVALLACFLPAWRAMNVDPVIALRNE